MIGTTNLATYLVQALDARKAKTINIYAFQYDHSGSRGYILIDGVKVGEVSGRGTDVFKLSRTDLSVMEHTHEDTYGAGCAGTVASLKSVSSDQIIILSSMDATQNSSAVNAELNKMGVSVSATWGAARYAIVFIGMLGLTPGKGYFTYAGGGNDASWGGILLPHASLGITNYNGDYVKLDNNGQLVKYTGQYTFFGY